MATTKETKTKIFKHVSVSQMKTAKTCLRLWLLEKYFKMPGDSSYGALYGGQLHKCIERMLQGEKDIYPKPVKGIPQEDHERIIEQVEIYRDFIKDDKRPFLVEHHIQGLPVLENLPLEGFIDQLYETEVRDHKSGLPDYMILRPEDLADDLQLLCYAYALQKMRLAKGLDLLDKVTLTHTQFPRKGKLLFKYTTVDVDQDQILKGWDLAVELSSLMWEHWHKGYTPETILECPSRFDENDQNACRLFGKQCKAFDICRGLKNPRKIIDLFCVTKEDVLVSEADLKEKQNMTAANRMDMVAKMKALRAGKASASDEEKKPKKTVAKKPKIVDVPELPWIVDSCKACKGTGVNSKEAPCRICLNAAEEGYEIGDPEEGAIVFRLEGDEAWSRYVIPSETEEEMVEPPEEEYFEAEEEPETEAEEEEEAEEVEEEEDEIEKFQPKKRKFNIEKPAKSPGRPSGPRLLIDVIPYTSPQFLSLEAEFYAWANKLVQTVKIGKDRRHYENYFEAPTWERRDAVAANIVSFVEWLDNKLYMASSGNPDMDVALSALKGSGKLRECFQGHRA